MDPATFDVAAVVHAAEFEAQAVTSAQDLYDGPDGSTLPGTDARVGGLSGDVHPPGEPLLAVPRS